MKKIVFRIFTLMLCAIMLVPSGIFSVSAVTSTAAVEDNSYVWPVTDQTFTQNFKKDSHLAIDIGAAEGTPIYAALGGKVICASTASTSATAACSNCLYEGVGYHVVINQPDGHYALYAHMSSVDVKTGDNISTGTKLGALGNTGNSNGAHLHFAIIKITNGSWHTRYGIDPITKLTPYKSVYADNITSTDATLYAYFGVRKMEVKQSGIYIGTSPENMTKITENTNLGWGHDNTHLYYNLNKWYAPLTNGTRYYYQFWQLSYDTEYRSDIYTFVAGGDVKQSVKASEIPVEPEVTEKYIVTFKNYDGTVLSSVEYEKGATVVVPATPTRTADDTYTYTFTGWDKEITAVNGNVEYVAQYTATAIPVNNATAMVGSAKAKAGQTITLDITVENADKIGSLAISNITYNGDILQFVSFEWKVEDALLKRFDAANGMGAAAFETDMDVNGVIGTLTFKIKDGVEDSDYAVSCNIEAKINNVDYAIFDVAGAVTVYSVVTGDADGDEQITKDDAIYILMHTFFADTYPANQDLDFDGDGQVSKDDAIYVLMYTFFPDTYPLN